MTQTTSERIATLINEGVDCSCDGGWTHESVVGVLEVAAVIAAEIDALARERDEARAEVATLTLKLANARLNLKHCSEEVDKRDECAGQLAESRAEVESCRKAYAQMRSTEDEWKRDTLAALKAEVERLRPAADKWQESLEYWRESGHRAKEAMLEAEESAAARAAKGAQP